MTDNRQYETLLIALLLMLGQEKDGSTRLRFDSAEMSRSSHYDVKLYRYLDPYFLEIEVTPK